MLTLQARLHDRQGHSLAKVGNAEVDTGHTSVTPEEVTGTWIWSVEIVIVE